MWVYEETGKGVYTVGYYNPKGEFIAESDHTSRGEAAKRVHYLNGGRNR